MSKVARQRVLLELVENGPVWSQEELVVGLARRGIHATQATLSRDIRELGLAKTGDGYMVPNGQPAQAAPTPMPPIHRMIHEFVTDVREAQNLLVIKTTVGSAQPVAGALDAEEWPEVVGTVAGDDTILVISPDVKSARRLATRIAELMAG